jgi:hypothetical protein
MLPKLRWRKGADMRWIYRFAACIAAIPLCVCGQVVADAPVILQIGSEGTASATVVVRNAGNTVAPLQLRFTDLQRTGSDGKLYDLNATRIIAPASEKDKPVYDEGKLPPGESLTLQIGVAGVKAAGQFSASLKNAGREIAPVKAVRIPADYNVRIVSANSASPEIVFRGAPVYSFRAQALVGLENLDASSYRFKWKLRVGDAIYPGGEVELPGNSTAFLDVSSAAPTANWITAGTLKDDTAPGDLILSPLFTGDLVSPDITVKHLPVTVRLQYWSGWLQELINLLCIFALLAMGGMMSIWVHHGMPNTSRALALKRELRDVQSKIDGLGGEIDSRWRVLLKVQPDRLSRELQATWWVFPSFSGTLDQLGKDLDTLRQWTDTVYNFAIVDRHARQLLQDKGIPPAIDCWICEITSRALETMESGFTTPEETKAMRDGLQRAQTLIAGVQSGVQIKELEDTIVAREKALAPHIEELKLWTKAAPWQEFSGIVDQVVCAMAAPPAPQDYIDRDRFSMQLLLMNEVREYRKRHPVAMTAAVSGSAPQASAADPQTQELRDCLKVETCEALRMAQVLVTAMRQNKSGQDLVEALGKGAASIIVDPVPVKPNAPVRLELRFEEDELNEAAIRQKFRCRWDFGDGTRRESGWQVAHAFSRGQFAVGVTVSNLEGQAIEHCDMPIDVGDGPAVGNAAVRLMRWLTPHAETMLEASRLALILAIALFGLMAVAQQQAQNVTWLEAVGAVFALGFGADTVKNLVTQKPPPDSNR